MPLTHAMTPVKPYASHGSALLLFAPLLAYAADQALAAFDPSTPRFWGTLAVVQALNVLGWAASSLPQLAKWIDGDTVRERLENRLTIIQGLALSFMAGNIAYYGGRYYMALAEILCFIAAAVKQ